MFFFISEKVVSRQYWERRSIDFYRINDSIQITIKFIDYEFGPFGEHGFLEWCEIAFSLDKFNYKPLIRCETEDQERKDSSVVCLKNKLLGAKIEAATEYFEPYNFIKLSELRDLCVNVKNTNVSKGGVRLLWTVPSDINIKYFLVNGLWKVNGLYCKDEIDGEVYKIKALTKNSHLEIKTDFQQKYVSTQIENNSVEVLSEADAVVLKGVIPGANIRVYTTSGTLVKYQFANQDVVYLKLPSNQMYIIHVNQASYKVIL